VPTIRTPAQTRPVKKVDKLTWRLGLVVIVSASRTEDRGFESRQGVRFLGLSTFQLCSFCAFE
jgi:hypothetical protein